MAETNRNLQVQVVTTYPLYLSSSDHPNMSIGNIMFNRSNYLAWSRSIKIGVGAKLKLGFIDGSLQRPNPNSTNLLHWIQYDNMVRSWLLSLMQNDFTQNYLNTQSAFELWENIEEQYGHGNGPLLIQLSNELSNTRQLSQSVKTYYNRLKRLCDELQALYAYLTCDCG